MDYDYEKIKLKKLIIQNALVVSKDLITLSGGQKSHHYYDIKKVVLEPLGARLISVLMLEEILKFGRVKSVGGLEVGAIPIASAISLRSNDTHDNISVFYVRKKPKEHGLKHRVEGNPIEPIVIVDDVITKGDSVIETIEALRAEGKTMLGVVSIIDRGGGKKRLEKNGIKHSSIFEDKDFKKVVSKKLAELDCKP